jgi:hypothetical protein
VTTLADPSFPYATISLPPPVYSDNCSAIDDISVTWTMSAPTAGSGIGIIPVPYRFNVGITTVTYSFTDECGNVSTCTFIITVDPNYPPVITCPPDIIRNTDAGICTATLDPGFPTLVSGTLPVVFTWVMTGATTGSGTGPITPNPYTFNAGITTITWRATNSEGFDECSQTITVVDNQPPAFIPPPPPSLCVEIIHLADYWDPTVDITPVRPEYYTFVSGTPFLDISGMTDNCCLPQNMVIHWQINFTPTPDPVPPHNLVNTPPINGTGQPSLYGADFQLPGDGVNFTDVVHTITFTLTDCNGNSSLPVTVNITVKPRPDVIKQN